MAKKKVPDPVLERAGRLFLLTWPSLLQTEDATFGPVPAFRGKGLRDRSGFRVSGSGFRVSGSNFRVPGSGFRVPGFGFRVSGFGFYRSFADQCEQQPTLKPSIPFRDWGLGFRVRAAALGFRV